jgi:(R,R)-butanediol dehydrogenase/meso-butanediol dehydrogenase/diacetyl reductase
VKAVRAHAIGDIRFEEVAAPPDPGRDEVVVAPFWCGICGSDLKEYTGPVGGVPVTPHPLTGAMKPLILGHEYSARVVAIGPGVTNYRVGDRVAVMPLLYCGRCRECLRGEYLFCADKAFSGLSMRWGGLGDLALLRAYQLTPLGDLSDEEGALVEPAAVALGAVMNARVAPGDSVLVVGCGPIGALVILALLAIGATAYASDPNEARAANAVTLGAVASVRGDNAAQLAQLGEATGGVAMDVAIDCAGKPGTVDLCIAAVKPGGIVCVPGVHSAPTVIDVRTLTRKPVSIVGSLAYTRAQWDRTLALIGAGRFAVERLITSRITRDRIVPDGFQALLEPERLEMKILVRVG